MSFSINLGVRVLLDSIYIYITDSGGGESFTLASLVSMPTVHVQVNAKIQLVLRV